LNSSKLFVASLDRFSLFVAIYLHHFFKCKYEVIGMYA